MDAIPEGEESDEDTSGSDDSHIYSEIPELPLPPRPTFDESLSDDGYERPTDDGYERPPWTSNEERIRVELEIKGAGNIYQRLTLRQIIKGHSTLSVVAISATTALTAMALFGVIMTIWQFGGSTGMLTSII